MILKLVGCLGIFLVSIIIKIWWELYKCFKFRNGKRVEVIMIEDVNWGYM